MGTGTLNPQRFLQGENIRLKKENQDLRDEVNALRNAVNALVTLHDVAASINAATDVLALLDRILEMALASISVIDGSLLLVDSEAQELAFVVVHGEVRESLKGYRMPIGEGIAGWVAKNGRSVIVGDASLDPRFSPQIDQAFQFHTNSILAVPIIYGSQVLGVLQAINKSGADQFSRTDRKLFEVVAQIAAIALHKAETAGSSES